MFRFILNFMNNAKENKLIQVNNKHRVLNTEIDKEPNPEEDSIIFGCGCFWGAEKCFGNFQEL